MLPIALILFLLHFCQTEDSCDANRDALCQNKSEDNPHLTEVTDWLNSLHEIKVKPLTEPLIAEAKPLVKIVSCDEGAWNYKYTAKGRPLGARCQWGTHVARVPCALYTSLMIVILSVIITIQPSFILLKNTQP